MEILIASDDETVTRQISGILSQFKPEWRSSVFNSGQKCLQQIKCNHKPDIIITGSKLADATGLHLILDIVNASSVPIVFISVENNLTEMIEIFDAGAWDYISLPLNGNVFVAKLGAILRRNIWNNRRNKEQ